MEDTWHILKWVYAAVLCLYMVVQVLAVRRLRGIQKKRSRAVMTVMIVLMSVSDAIRNIFFFEDRVASRTGAVVVAVGAIVATLVLLTLFGETATDTAAGEGEAERGIESLKLS